MQVFHEADFPYRHGDHGPKYLLRGPRMNFGFVRLRRETLFLRIIIKLWKKTFIFWKEKLPLLLMASLWPPTRAILSIWNPAIRTASKTKRIPCCKW